MALLIDTGFLYAVYDANDANHQKSIDFLYHLDVTEEIILPTPVIVELAYLIQSRIGHHAMRTVVGQLRHGPLQFQAVVETDLNRIYELLDQYADNELDYVDAAIVTVAERLNITSILTVDQRDFRIIRPKHCDYFEILPS